MITPISCPRASISSTTSIKPFPVSAAERLRGGVGIMADDVVGGVMVNLFLQALNGYLWGEGWLWALLAR